MTPTIRIPSPPIAVIPVTIHSEVKGKSPNQKKRERKRK